MNLFESIIVVLSLTTLLCLYRVAKGPKPWDRLIAVNVVGTKTVVLLVLVGFVYDSLYFIDVALVYTLLNFVMTLAVSKYLETGGV